MRKIALLCLLVLAASACIPDPSFWHETMVAYPYGKDYEDIVEATGEPAWENPGGANFRTSCELARRDYSDAIVWPGQPFQSAHLHSFYGNKQSVEYGYTTTNPRTQGPGMVASSTCDGGTANLTSYWAPSMIDVTGISGCNWMSEECGEQIVEHNTTDHNDLMVYYKEGANGVESRISDYGYTATCSGGLPGTGPCSPTGWRARDIQNFPAGLVIIAGSSTATSPQSSLVVRNACEGGTPSASSTLPLCPPGDTLWVSVHFPQCWDGANLDSPNHKSHLAYPLGWPNKGCPNRHPVPLTEITQNFRYTVPSTGMAGWRLSSDPPGVAPGTTSHADWVNGWDQAVFQTMIDECYGNKADCHMNLLGDGTMLNG